MGFKTKEGENLEVYQTVDNLLSDYFYAQGTVIAEWSTDWDKSKKDRLFTILHYRRKLFKGIDEAILSWY